MGICGGGVSGGAGAEPQLISSLEQFIVEVEGDEPKVLYVDGVFEAAQIRIGSNKTIIGCSPAAVVQGSLHVGTGSSNVILRNLEIRGYAQGDCLLDPSVGAGESCSVGQDAVAINGNAHHNWVDHCWISDGTDGNLDITNDADFVSVSWSKFSYTLRSDLDGSDGTGAAGHRFSNLDESSAHILVGQGEGDNHYESVTGERAMGGGGRPWVLPPYEYELDAVDSIPAAVKMGAGPR